jgi:hypothetical protein
MDDDNRVEDEEEEEDDDDDGGLAKVSLPVLKAHCTLWTGESLLSNGILSG